MTKKLYKFVTKEEIEGLLEDLDVDQGVSPRSEDTIRKLLRERDAYREGWAWEIEANSHSVFDDCLADADIKARTILSKQQQENGGKAS